VTRIFLVVAALVLVLALACNSPSPSPTSTPNTPTPTQTATRPAEATPTPTATPSTSAQEVSGDFFLTVLTPISESVVNQSTVQVQGRTLPDAVVTVNGEMVAVDGEGRFSTVVLLEEGPNVIEVIASDFEGNQESQVITVIYAA